MFECTECFDEFEIEFEVCPSCETTTTAPSTNKLVAVSALTAEFITKAGSSSLDKRVGDLWPIQEDVSYNFITDVERKFKNRNKFYSYFEEKKSAFSTPSRFQSFIKDYGITKDRKHFVELVNALMEDMVDAAHADGVHRLAGGNVVFMHYKSQEEEDIGRLLVILVDKIDGFNFDSDNLVPTNVEHINLNAFRQAALFDLTLFDGIYPEIPTEETYVRFIQGNSQAEFFKNTFGCEVKADNKLSVSQAYEALSSFQEDKKLPTNFYDRAQAKLDIAFEKAAKAKTSISLVTIANEIESVLPSDSKHRGTFADYANNNGFQINDFIEPTAFSLSAEKWLKIKDSDDNFEARVFRKKIGSSGSGDPVEYNEDSFQLTLKITDVAMRKKLEKLVKKAHE